MDWYGEYIKKEVDIINREDFNRLATIEKEINDIRINVWDFKWWNIFNDTHIRALQGSFLLQTLKNYSIIYYKTEKKINRKVEA